MSYPVHVTTAFNNFFAGIGTKLALKIEPSKNHFTSLLKKHDKFNISYRYKNCCNCEANILTRY